MTEEAEQRIWDLARAGDRDAIDEVLRRHEKTIYRFGLRLCGDEEAAREVLQRTMLAAFEQLGTFRGDAKFSTWLYSLARSACSRIHRGTRSAPIHDVGLDAPYAPVLLDESLSPDRHAEVSQLADVVAVAISMLPDNYREAVVLRDVEGLPADEAAEVAKVGVPALKSRLHRGREMLRSTLVTLMREGEGVIGGARACPKLAEELARIEPGEVDQAACKSIEAHIAECAECADALGDLRDAAALCRRLPSDEVPAPVQRALRSVITEALGA